MQHLDDGTIHAWLDGALGAAQADDVGAHVAVCRACADRVAEARGLIAASSRILTALDDVPANVVPAETRVAAAARVASPAIAAAAPPVERVAPHARWWGHRYSRLAAVLAFVAAGTLVLTREANRHDVALRRETLPNTDAMRAQRDSAPTRSGAPAAPSPAPSAALGGRLPHASATPTLKPQVKSFAQEARQQAAAAKKSPPAAAAGVSGNANKPADAASPAAPAQPSSTLVARRLGEGKRLQLEEVVVTGQATSAPTRPRLVSVDSVQRAGTTIRRETYTIPSGTRVVLEVTPASAMPNDSAAAAAGALADSAAAGDSSSAAIHAIRWRGADGTGYALSGPVSTEELQRIRTSLGRRP